MTRQKKKKDESDIAIFSFGIDKNDPKYQNLIAFLEEIDSGARSYVIRQMLNSYVNSQTPSPVFGLLNPTPQPAPQPQTQPAAYQPSQPVVQPPIEQPPHSPPAHQEQVFEEVKVSPVIEAPTPVVKESPVVKDDVNPVNVISPEEKKIKKPKKDSRLASLANTFN